MVWFLAVYGVMLLLRRYTHRDLLELLVFSSTLHPSRKQSVYVCTYRAKLSDGIEIKKTNYSYLAFGPVGLRSTHQELCNTQTHRLIVSIPLVRSHCGVRPPSCSGPRSFNIPGSIMVWRVEVGTPSSFWSFLTARLQDTSTTRNLFRRRFRLLSGPAKWRIRLYDHHGLCIAVSLGMKQVSMEPEGDECGNEARA